MGDAASEVCRKWLWQCLLVGQKCSIHGSTSPSIDRKRECFTQTHNQQRNAHQEFHTKVKLIIARFSPMETICNSCSQQRDCFKQRGPYLSTRTRETATCKDTGKLLWEQRRKEAQGHRLFSGTMLNNIMLSECHSSVYAPLISVVSHYTLQKWFACV